MSVTIRLTRAGSKKVPFYRVVAADSRSPRDGRFIEQLGVDHPLRDPPEFRVNNDRILHWISGRRAAEPDRGRAAARAEEDGAARGRRAQVGVLSQTIMSIAP